MQRTAAAPRISAALWAVAGVLAVWAMAFPHLRNSDLWWHLASGRRIANGGLPLVDPFSFTAFGKPWHNHEWLADLILFAWSRAFGLASLVWCLWGIAILTFSTVAGTAVRWSSGRVEAAVLATIGAAAVALPLFEIRPHLFSLLGLAVLEAVLSCSRRRIRWALPALFVLWANLHSGASFGLAALFCWLSAEALVEKLPAWRSRLALLAACAAGMLCNPFGVQVLTLPARYAFDSSSPFRSLREWLPPLAPGGVITPLFLPGLVIASLAAGFLLAQRRVELAGPLAVGFLGAAFALRSGRFIPLFAIAAAPIVASALAALAALAGSKASPRAPGRPHAATYVLAALVASIAGWRLSGLPIGARAFGPLVGLESFPVATAEFLSANGIRGDVFAYQSHAGYLLYRLDGAVRVFFDGRMDTVYDAAVFEQWNGVLQARDGWIRTVEASTAQFFLWPLRDDDDLQVRQPAELLATGRWREIYRGANEILLARVGEALPSPLRAPARSAWTELARGNDAMQNGLGETAEEAFRAALALDATLLPACRNLARLEAHRHALEEALRTLRGCEHIYPEPGQGADLKRLAGRST